VSAHLFAMAPRRPFGRNFLPGPTDVHPEVMEALQQPLYAHRSPQMQALLEEVQPRLQRLFGTTQPVFIVTSSGTGLMEAAIRNAVHHRVLVVVGGYFGEMFARVAESCGREVIRASVPPGRTIEPDQLEAFLDGPRVDAVALVHSETSTGALAPLEELARVVRAQSDVLLLVDGVTSVGGLAVETDRWGVDFILTGSQKALALPPGLAFGAASRRLLERAETIDDAGFYFSAKRAVSVARAHLPFSTPALSLYFALQRQLRRINDQGGLPARFERHRAMAARVAQWVEGHPAVSLMTGEGRRSPTVSALRLPQGRDPASVAAALEERGYLVGAGLTPKLPTIRIGHMGDLEPAHVDALLAELEPLI